MRLLTTDKLEFVDIQDDSSIPTYAILSHTWAEQEVSHKEMRKYRQAAEAKKGFTKIRMCAQLAKKDKIGHIWVDTCNIDKSSSADLSEAINSMYRYYKNAKVCYAYLADVEDVPAQGASKEAVSEWEKAFQRSRWFTRGWTLQELIAPSNLVFYSKNWRHVGTKKDRAYLVNYATGIPYDVLMWGDLSNTCTAQRMSWASNRSLARIEDRAYCLLGIFDVNMPMLYGEGEKAFTRLQDEIIKVSDDMSIFAWIDPSASFSTFRGLLARKPADFAGCKDIRWFRPPRKLPPYQVTNKGIRLESRLIPSTPSNVPLEFTTPLLGVFHIKRQEDQIRLKLQKVGNDQYARVELDKMQFDRNKGHDPFVNLDTIYVRSKTEIEFSNHSRAKGIHLRIISKHITLIQCEPYGQWDEKTGLYSFAKPATVAPPPVVKFHLRLDLEPEEKLCITLDAKQQWSKISKVVFTQDGWQEKVVDDQIRKTVTCFKTSRPSVRITVKRGLRDDDMTITMTVGTRV